MAEHLGYEKHSTDGHHSGNSRNGTRSKTVITEIGPVELSVPRDRAGTFEPQTIRKRQRRLEGVDSMVISLAAKGLTTGEVQAHLVEVFGTEVSRETISKITDAVLEDMAGWLMRPLDRVYPVVFIDAIHVKVRDGQVANRAFYCAIGVTVDGSARHPGAFAARRRPDPHRAPQPRCHRCLHRGVRRPQRPPRRDHHDLAPGDRADLRAAPAPQHVPAQRPPRRGEDGQRPSTRVHRWKPALNAFAIAFDGRLFPIDQ